MLVSVVSPPPPFLLRDQGVWNGLESRNDLLKISLQKGRLKSLLLMKTEGDFLVYVVSLLFLRGGGGGGVTG